MGSLVSQDRAQKSMLLPTEAEVGSTLASPLKSSLLPQRGIMCPGTVSCGKVVGARRKAQKSRTRREARLSDTKVNITTHCPQEPCSQGTGGDRGESHHSGVEFC